MKIELEVTSEIKEFICHYASLDLLGNIKSSSTKVAYQIKRAIQKEKNKIKPGDLIRYNNPFDHIDYFIAYKHNGVTWQVQNGQTSFHEYFCTKASPEEERIIKPLLET